MKPKTLDLGLLILLVTFGVVGRWMQPTWSLTPTAAVALFAGYYLSSRWLALAVPVGVLAISNLILPAYEDTGVMLVVYAAMLLPALFGRQLRHSSSYGRLALFSVLPAVTFFITTNFAVWALLDLYPHTAAGLGLCYAAGLPFFRMMLLGDVLYTAIVFGAYVFATGRGYLPTMLARRHPAPVRVSRS